MSCKKKNHHYKICNPFLTPKATYSNFINMQTEYMYSVSTFDKQTLINTNQMKLQSMPAFTQVLQTYINRLYYFGSCIYSLSKGMLMSGLHKPAA